MGIDTRNEDTHGAQTVNTIVGQFDGLLQLRETDAGEVECRLRGLGRRPTVWQPLS